MKRRHWSDLSQRQRTVVAGAGAVQVALLAAALTDVARRSPDELRGSKPMWVALSFVNFVGPLAYFAVGRRRRSS